PPADAIVLPELVAAAPADPSAATSASAVPSTAVEAPAEAEAAAGSPSEAAPAAEAAAAAVTPEQPPPGEPQLVEVWRPGRPEGAPRHRRPPQRPSEDRRRRE